MLVSGGINIRRSSGDVLSWQPYGEFGWSAHLPQVYDIDVLWGRIFYPLYGLLLWSFP